MSDSSSKLGFNATWSMAVGGMVGGGIFSTLGVVIGVAGPLAWVSFLAAGLVALGAGYSYTKLAGRFDESGGAFIFLRHAHAPNFAGTLSWILLAGYVLTNAVYAFTFGHYLGHVVDLGPWFPRAAGVAIIAVFVGLNLRGVGEAGGAEVFLVWFKMAVLVGLAAWGLARWDPPMLGRGVPDAGLSTAIFGAAAVFMAYEGFQLLTYDYDDIESPKKTLPRAMLSAIIAVIITYILVSLGVAMLIGADKVMEHQEVSLAIAGREAAGVTGLIVVTIAAAFSTGSAINSTLFATSRLASVVSRDHELPGWLGRKNHRGVPDRAVIALGVPAAVLAAVGSLGSLVESASLAFLFTFTVVCGLAWHLRAGRRFLTGPATVLAAAATIALCVRLAREDPWPLGIFLGFALLAAFVRPLVTHQDRSGDALEKSEQDGASRS